MQHDEPIATYRPPAHLIWLVGVPGALLAVAMLYAMLTVEAATLGHTVTRWLLLTVGIGLLARAYDLAATRTRVLDDRVETIGAFSSHTLHARDIAGFRNAAPQGYIRLVPDAPIAQSMRAPREIMRCADRVTWIDKLIDLDDADRKALDRAVRNNPRFGATEGDRLAFVGRARMRVVWLTIAALAVIPWALVWPEPRAIVVTTLALLPLLSIAVALHARPAIRVLESDRRTAKLDLFLALAMPSIVLLVMGQQAALIDRPSAAMFAAGAAIACGLGWLDPLLHRRWLALIVLGAVGFGYAHGVTVEANILLDRAGPARVERTVHEKHTTGRIFPSHKFVLRPWLDGKTERDIEVPRDLYDSLAVGARVCIAVHPGALGLRWYEAERCSVPPAAPAQADPA